MHLLEILGGLTPVKFPPFPLVVKLMRGTRRWLDMSAPIITRVSTGEER
jgi:hypothetical protein